MTKRTLAAADRDAMLHTLETLVDRAGLYTVLDTLHALCGLKAAHVAENWQDTKLARQWEAAAGQIGQAQAWIPEDM